MIFITGGVRSGKSSFAERLVQQFGQDLQYYYIATGVAFDQEMVARITRHQLDREKQGLRWQTIEIQVEIPDAIKQLNAQYVLLFECVTTWLANVLYHTETLENREQRIADYVLAFQTQLLAWQRQGVQVVIVSNEILDEPRASNEEVELYRALIGNLHQWIVAHCESVYEVQYQLVQQWK
ncbi:adenosylcobinamide kinase [Solibacillus sp. R5-41]|uniref:bifunctional adenosylcobinamide kinase/adenosylcobinamide-phosphate guanylyltransferase n=1 Tax=Solibacillus sp. R5-41 TaxID=2048654 RepID=UPI000C126CA7|nr:bifunctional adenosylcobinamide kinase/adenosylcobinamide-phosphate guanylyltransferase [Solibacillus sp. R5-41]ATP39529.1 adenosylcobinamide kinase [Solibacillus sp. R5-41]